MTKIYIVIYTMYGHIHTLAQEIKKGVESVEGCTAELYQVPELLSEDILQKMFAKPKPDIPIISAEMLPEADGFIFGFPTRFGCMPAQMKSFFDSTGKLWVTQALAGKPGGLFTSTSSQGGGQETTLLTSVTQFAHHGIIYVPVGYTVGLQVMGDVDEARGGSPYGAGTLAGPTGQRAVSEVELKIALQQGKHFAKIASKLKS